MIWGNGATTTFIRELVSEMNIPVVNILVIAFTLYLFGDWHRKKTVEFWCTMPDGMGTAGLSQMHGGRRRFIWFVACICGGGAVAEKSVYLKTSDERCSCLGMKSISPTTVWPM